MFFDLATLKIFATLPAGKNPDAICYEPTTHRVFAFNGKKRHGDRDRCGQRKKSLEKSRSRVKPDSPLRMVRARSLTPRNKSQVLKITPRLWPLEACWNLPEGSDPPAWPSTRRNRAFHWVRQPNSGRMDSSSVGSLRPLPWRRLDAAFMIRPANAPLPPAATVP